MQFGKEMMKLAVDQLRDAQMILNGEDMAEKQLLPSCGNCRRIHI
jgi:hypothetical protein